MKKYQPHPLYEVLAIHVNTGKAMHTFTSVLIVSNSSDPDQAQCFVGPDLGPNYLQKLSADNTSR